MISQDKRPLLLPVFALAVALGTLLFTTYPDVRRAIEGVQEPRFHNVLEGFREAENLVRLFARWTGQDVEVFLAQPETLPSGHYVCVLKTATAEVSESAPRATEACDRALVRLGNMPGVVEGKRSTRRRLRNDRYSPHKFGFL